jgi:LysM repeat protein
VTAAKSIATLKPPRGLGLGAAVLEALTGHKPPGAAAAPAHKVPDAARIAFTVLNSNDTVTALADLNTGRPTITGGGAKWNTIDRPRLVGLTVFAGYDPLQMTVPLLFDDLIAGNSVEPDLDTLWKFWGRGPRAANASANKQPLPLIVDGELLPRMVRFAAVSNPAPPNWVITNISEDAASAVHNAANHVVRLAVTVTLEEYNASSALGSLADDGGSSTSRTKTITYPKGMTMRKVARQQRTTVKALQKLNDGNQKLEPYLRDPSLKFKRPLKVKVPRVSA